VDGYVCYTIEIPSTNDVPPGEHTLTIRHALKNPTSVAAAGAITIRTMLKLTSETDWAYIDMAAIASNYRASPGTIAKNAITVEPPAVSAALGIAAEQVVSTTYAPNQLLDFRFTPTHAVPRGGYLQVRYPPGTFTFNAAATAVAQFSVRAGSAGSVATIQDVVETADDTCTAAAAGEYGCILGIVNDAGGLIAGTEYTVRVAGLRNPRHVIDYEALEASAPGSVNYWQVRTYASGATPDDANTLIDVGNGGARSILTAAAIPTFGVEAYNTTNGVAGRYFITWYSEIAAAAQDVLAIPFPAETSFAAPSGTARLKCTPVIDSLPSNGVSCTFRANQVDEKVGSTWKYGPDYITSQSKTIDGQTYTYEQRPDYYNVLEMKLTAITRSTGLYKVEVEAVKNPASRRGSSPFGRIAHTTESGADIAEYRVTQSTEIDGSTLAFDSQGAPVFAVPPVTIQTEYGSDLQDVDAGDVTQHSEEEGKEDVAVLYELRFKPYSVVRAVNDNGATAKIVVSYPKQVEPQVAQEAATAQDFPDEDERASKWRVTEGCSVYEDRTLRAEAKCFRAKAGRLFEIHDALSTDGDGFSGTVTIMLSFQNPADNWDAVGFRIKTYEVTASGTALADKLEGDALRPTLQCQAPCRRCQQIDDIKKLSVTDPSGLIDVEGYARGYCDECWQDNPLKYLMTRTPYNVDTGDGDSTCLTRCANGWTSNHDVDHRCEQCDETCLTCEDQGQPIGDLKEGEKEDKFKCTACSTAFPFFYGAAQACLKDCERYPLQATDGTKPSGLYKITSDDCGQCDPVCLRCDGDKFNCTRCDVDEEKALFQKRMAIGGRVQLQGTCAKQCPNTYYMDQNADVPNCERS
jgi:hypothetical protein